MQIKKRIISVLTSVGMVAAAFSGITSSVSDNLNLNVYAAASYPVQEFRLGMSDTDHNVTASGTALAPAEIKGTDNEKWSLNYVSSGVYEIVNSSNGYILTANGSGVTLAADTNGTNQRWKIEGVQKDFEGFDLYYKITSYADSTKALTYTEGVGFGLSSYSGAAYQKYKNLFS